MGTTTHALNAGSLPPPRRRLVAPHQVISEPVIDFGKFGQAEASEEFAKDCENALMAIAQFGEQAAASCQPGACSQPLGPGLTNTTTTLMTPTACMITA